MSLRVLIGCEFSGAVRDAFLRNGIKAMSCDLLPSDSDMGPHYEGDIAHILNDGWDCAIFFPPCTYVCNSGVRWLYKHGRKENGIDPIRWMEMGKAVAFFRLLMDAPIPHIAIENPVPHGHADLPDFTQSVQPWQFGHGEVKRTCFWLKNLPKLRSTCIVYGRKPRVHHESPSEDRWKRRSITYPGIADAMAEQWGNYLKEKYQ